MKIGYARVSTLEQNLDLQLQALKKAGCKKIFREKVSGAATNRPEFQRMLEQIRDGDVVAVWKLDRLARSTRDLIRERTSAGRAAAKKRGVRFGRPRKLNADQIRLAQRLLAEGRSVTEIASTFEVHVATIYRLAAER